MSPEPFRRARSALASLSLPAAGSRRRAVLTWGGLIAVPVIVAGLLGWAFGHGMVSQGSAVAAVVNNDTPITVNGQTVPLGRQLAQTLVHGDDRRYRWVLTDDDDASQGLAGGEYAAVVTIPADFSRRATSAATTKSPLTAAQGVITVTTSRDTALADALVSKDVATAATAATADEILQSYLDNVYIGFTTLHGKIGEAADGAEQLADGTGRASDGSRKVASVTGDLVVGLGTLARGAGQAASGATLLDNGAQKLKSGTAQLASGATTLSTGTRQLANGADQLATGLDTLRTKTAEMPDQTHRLADGARQVADGNAKLAKQVVPVADKVITVIDAVPDLDDEAHKLNRLARDCRKAVRSSAAPPQKAALPPDFCGDVDEVVDEIQDAARRAEAKKKDVRGQVVELRDGVIALKKGSAQVADGTEQLAEAAPALADGIEQAATAGNQLATGARSAATGAARLAAAGRQVATGTSTLASNTRTLADAVHQLSSGSTRAASGAVRLRSGATQLASGLGEVDRGAEDLADGLDSSRGKVPSYTSAEREHLKQVAASPAYVDDDSGDVLRAITGSFFIVIALWIGAMVTFVARPPVADGLLTSRASTLVLVLRGVAPGIAVLAVASLGLGGGLGAFLGLGAGRAALVVGVTLLAGTVFALCNQALAALFGRSGRLAGLAVLVITSALGVISTTPKAVTILNAFLPTHDAMTAIRAAAGGAGLGPALVKLLLWMLVGVVTIAYVTERRRSLPRWMLRPAPDDVPAADHGSSREPSPTTNPLPTVPSATGSIF
jgi:putative membrane protein